MGPRALVTIVPLLVLCCVQAIRVPVDWNSDSEVPNEKSTQDVDIIGEANVPASNSPIPIPLEYFQYPAKKPQFAIDVADFHGVKDPQNHYTAYPIHPYTGKEKPVLGKHQILDHHNPTFQQFQQFTKINDDDESSVSPISSEFEVFHPYKAEEPALQEIYKDPVIDKIRNDIYNSQTRLQKNEKDAGELNIKDGEYLESPEQADRKKIPHKNIPVLYEVHRPQRRPIYYRPSPYSSRDRYLNNRFRHPWNQHNAKIRPVHYRPLKSHLQRLRQNHAVKYDDEHNEYPQVPTYEHISEVPDGYDIYERGKEKYIALRNNVDESINNAVKENRPTTYQRLELQNNGDRTETQVGNDDQEFVPIKNYAQVRKTETRKHLPKSAAFEDAASLDEIKNAPRLREAIKSTKAQTVYTEEGYEDAAYDHEGEEKHAAENEAHGGHLKEKEISGGRFKAPSVSQKYKEANGNEYRDQILHGEEWKNNDKDKEEEADEENFSEDDIAHSIEADVYDDVTGARDKRQNGSAEKKQNSSEDRESDTEEKEKDTDLSVERSKRENQLKSSSAVNDTIDEHYINKRETNFEVPKINFNTTYLTADELKQQNEKIEQLKSRKIIEQPKLTDSKPDIKEKYPYYFRNLKNVNKDSPLRYAENLRFIPKKSRGGTEFYDSRSKILECPEVDDAVDALPEKLKKNGHPDESDSEQSEEESQRKADKADFSQIKKNQRLKGLGDKIDCFKAKFFGENPLDSPFFEEEIIHNPEPVTVPNLPVYKLAPKDSLTLASDLNNVFNFSRIKNSNPNATYLLDKLEGEQKSLQDSLIKSDQELRTSIQSAQNFSSNVFATPLIQRYVYADILENIKNHLRQPLINRDTQISKHLPQPNTNKILSTTNVTHNSQQNTENLTKLPILMRKRRASPFMYEPYKIIKDGQLQESKKTTTTSNISPLIKQLQTSRLIDRVSKNAEEKDQPVKRNVATRPYKDIGRKDRIKIEDKGAKDSSEARFVDVSVDSRRGEPKYEISLVNHNTKYSPVENKKSMSVQDYELQTNKTIKRPLMHEEQSEIITTSLPYSTRKSLKRKMPARPYFDVSQFIPKSTTNDTQNPSASNTVRKIVKSPTTIEKRKSEPAPNDNNDNENDGADYEEYDDEEVITTTTPKPVFRRRRPTSTTTKPEVEERQEVPKLRLITRFNTTPAPKGITEKLTLTTEQPAKVENEENLDSKSPKYREKKKKSSQSTLVTDTKSYGGDGDDMLKDEVDAMIGVQQDMDEYKPMYEKEMEGKIRKPVSSSASSEEDNNFNEDDDDEIDEEDDEDDDISDSEEDNSSNSSSSEIELEITTPEPTKQTLVRTTEAPISTTESRSAKLELKPIVHRKKIEIHKELPANKSLPHVTQFKQDYKEVEIIKEIPSRPKPNRISNKRPQKNLEALELYRDEKLAEEVNKLGAVEVFKENLDLVKGPRHGGNYRSANLEETRSISESPRRGNLKVSKDADTSQTKNEKLINIGEGLPARRANIRSSYSRPRNSRKSARLELEEKSHSNPKSLHGGNLKSIQDSEKKLESSRNEKYVELDEEENSNESTDETHDRNFDSSKPSSRPLHGGNYRSAKLVEDNSEDETADIKKKAAANNHRSKSAVLLNSFAQAVPHLTTTPAYILDPSKRMYYYVDAER